MMYIICSLLLCVILILEVESQSLLPQNNCENTSPRETEDSVMSRKLNEALETINKKFQNEISLLKDEIMQMKGKQEQKFREIENFLTSQSDSMKISNTKSKAQIRKMKQQLQHTDETLQNLLNATESINDISKRANQCQNKVQHMEGRLNSLENSTRREAIVSQERNEAMNRINSSMTMLKKNISLLDIGKEKLNDVAQKVVNQNKTMREFYVALKNLSDAKASSDTKFETRLIVINQTIKDHEGSISKLTQDLLNLNVSINFFTKSINRSDTKLVRFDTRLKNIEDVTGPMLAAIQREGENDKRMNGTIWSLQNDIRSIQKDILNATGIERKMANLERSMQQSEMRISFVNDELQGLKLRCGFTARLGNNTILGRKETLPFRQTYVNVGNAFNTSDFKFYAPVSGMYYFHLMVCSQRRYRSTANIVKGQKNIGFVYAEDQSNYDCAGNGVMTELASGEAVWASAAHDSNYDPNTFFTGFLATP